MSCRVKSRGCSHKTWFAPIRRVWWAWWLAFIAADGRNPLLCHTNKVRYELTRSLNTIVPILTTCVNRLIAADGRKFRTHVLHIQWEIWAYSELSYVSPEVTTFQPYKRTCIHHLKRGIAKDTPCLESQSLSICRRHYWNATAISRSCELQVAYNLGQQSTIALVKKVSPTPHYRLKPVGIHLPTYRSR